MDIEPVNPDKDAIFNLETLHVLDGEIELYALLTALPPNHLVNLQWRNATLTMRAGTIQAVLDLTHLAEQR